MPGIADAEIWDGRFFAGRQVPFAAVLTLTDTAADNDRGQRKKLFGRSKQLRGKNNGCACGHIHCLQVHIEQQLQAVVTYRDLLRHDTDMLRAGRQRKKHQANGPYIYIIEEGMFHRTSYFSVENR